MTEKRFKVHSMIQDMEVGEIIDLELCENLIKKYGSLSDIHLFIEDNGNDMTYQEVVNLLNENEQLRKENDMLSCELSVSANKEISRNCRIAELEEENEQLKQHNTELINKIDFLERIIDDDV